jgi:hypothetical protein
MSRGEEWRARNFARDARWSRGICRRRESYNDSRKTAAEVCELLALIAEQLPAVEFRVIEEVKVARSRWRVILRAGSVPIWPLLDR